MPNTNDSFITTLKKAHLEWGTHRHTSSRDIIYGEGYLQIPASEAYSLNITNIKTNLQSPEYNFSTSDGFIQNQKLLASGNQFRAEFAKQFHGLGDLKLLGDWFFNINAKIGDEVEIKWTSPTNIVLTKI